MITRAKFSTLDLEPYRNSERSSRGWHPEVGSKLSTCPAASGHSGASLSTWDRVKELAGSRWTLLGVARE